MSEKPGRLCACGGMTKLEYDWGGTSDFIVRRYCTRCGRHTRWCEYVVQANAEWERMMEHEIQSL